MKIKEKTRKLGAGCSKHCFEVVDKTDEVSSKHRFEVADRTDEVSSKHCFEVVDRTDEVSSKHGFEVVDEATLMWFEEIFEEYKKKAELEVNPILLLNSLKPFPDFLRIPWQIDKGRHLSKHLQRSPSPVGCV